VDGTYNSGGMVTHEIECNVYHKGHVVLVTSREQQQCQDQKGLKKRSEKGDATCRLGCQQELDRVLLVLIFYFILGCTYD